MIDFLRKIIEESFQNYKLFYISSDSCFFIYDEDKCDYSWILNFHVTEENKHNFHEQILNEEQIKFNKLMLDPTRDLNALPDWRYNTNLIICLRIPTDFSDDNSVFFNINKIEEDKALFKKYVIIYTVDSVQVINKFTYDDLKNEIDNPIQFDKFKNDMIKDKLSLNDMSKMRLVTQLFIKIPFFTYQIRMDHKGELLDLEKGIKEEIESKDLKKLNDILTELHPDHAIYIKNKTNTKSINTELLHHLLF